jgi:catechol 2,3-dioxygenase-like lactoylglutathione lyase family enzyme
LRQTIRWTDRHEKETTTMDWKIELIFVPVTDIDRAKDFYVNKLGFNADFDQRVNENLRFVQLTPPGSACSIAIGEGLGITMEPGTQNSIQVVIPDADAVLEELRAKGVEAEGVADLAWGRFITLHDPDGNRWTLQQLPAWSAQR